ncbi:MAG: DUF4406 domain-containing protein [Mucilaginibacter sp.]
MQKLQFLVNLSTQLAKNHKPVIYIAGKVTGLDPVLVKAKFDKAKVFLEGQGFKVLNPVDFISPTENWHTAMRMASTMLNMADHIYMLSDWNDSEGAKWEFAQAVKFNISCILE